MGTRSNQRNRLYHMLMIIALGMPDDYESSPSNYIGMDDAVTIPEATIIEQPHVAVETVTKPTAINGPPNYIIGEPPTMMVTLSQYA